MFNPLYFQLTYHKIGMLTVHQIIVIESLEGAEAICPKDHLEMAESMVCNATYPLTQASHQDAACHVKRSCSDVCVILFCGIGGTLMLARLLSH